MTGILITTALLGFIFIVLPVLEIAPSDAVKIFWRPFKGENADFILLLVLFFTGLIGAYFACFLVIFIFTVMISKMSKLRVIKR